MFLCKTCENSCEKLSQFAVNAIMACSFTLPKTVLLTVF